MTALKVLSLLKAILPKNKIGAWLLGLIAALLAIGLGVSNTDLKDAFCAAPAVSLPVLAEPKAEVPVQAPVVAPEKK